MVVPAPTYSLSSLYLSHTEWLGLFSGLDELLARFSGQFHIHGHDLLVKPLMIEVRDSPNLDDV